MRPRGLADKLLDIRRNKRNVIPMGREIKLDGGEISLLKKIGLLGAQMHGKILIAHIAEMETAEFLDTLAGLMNQDYVLSDKVNIHTIEDVEKAIFRINPTYARDLREAVNPAQRRERERKRQRRR